jgi:hypothetical protein
MVLSAELRIRTDPAQMDDVISQIGKAFEMTPVEGETSGNEQLFHITPRKPPQTLPSISVVYFTADDDSPVTPGKLRSLFSNPIYVRLEPYSSGIVDDELWISAAAMLARREGVEQFLVNMLFTLQTSLGVEGSDRPTDDVPGAEYLPPVPEGDIGIELPVSLRLTAAKDTLRQITQTLGLVLVLYEQKHSGRSGVKHFAARLSQVERDLPALSAKYVSPQQIFANPPGFTEEFLKVATDKNVMWSLFANPMYTGIAEFPRLMSVERWLRSASLLLRDSGIEQFLVNMLYMMRRSVRDWQPPEA